YTLNTGCYATIPFTVKPTVTPAVTISHSPGGTLCQGTAETFTANPVNGGIPTYQWYLFVNPIPLATNATYSYTPANGDWLSVQMITHFSCTVLDTIVLDSLLLDVFPVNSGPIVNITSFPPMAYATFLGQVYTFFANVTWGGVSPAYQWYMNGIAIPGADSAFYSTPVYKDDTFYCTVTGTTPCNAMSTVGTSDSIIVYATYLGVEPVSLTTSNLVLFPNPSNGNMVLSGTVNVNVQSDINIEVIDMLGRNVYSGKTSPQNGAVQEQINLGNLPGGAYLLHVNSESINQVFHFVISK
ncbi:MAG: T9SS type A sorting domain-containing protein, partial [Legionellales bacterium]